MLLETLRRSLVDSMDKHLSLLAGMYAALCMLRTSCQHSAEQPDR